jgi:hypothetical protein
MMLALLGIIACLNSPLSQPPPTPVVEVPIETHPTHPVEGGECIQACLRQNMARAVSADVIQADCEQACGADTVGTPSLLGD